jgi:gluconate 2-dehydrogenase gamma chain
MDDIQNRRTFLRAAVSASVAWAAADLTQIEDALAWAADQAQSRDPARVAVLTKVEAEAIDAMASRILPPVDGRPGAHELGVLYFIDRALNTFNAGQRKVYAAGVADLNLRATRRSNATTSFAALPPVEQDAILRDIEATPFFQAVRFDTIVGAFALPAWGGNRDYAGWHMLGLEHRPRFQAPFGYYDAEANERS